MENFNQKDFERYVMERRLNDPRYQNIPLNSDIKNNSYNDSSSDDSDNDNGKREVDRILNNKVKKNTLPPTIIKKNTLIISSLDRDLQDMSQNRFNFKVKFAPTSDSYKKKFPIYENSEFFLQTEYQKKLGIQGYFRDLEQVKLKESLKVSGYSTASRQCSEQPGNMKFISSDPLGNFVGYNYLYESSDSNGANIQKKFNYIHSIEIKKLILPNRVQTYPYNTTIYGSIWDNVPYLYIKIPELSENYSSTSSDLREAFSVLVKEKGSNNLEMNPFSYTTFVPINDDIHIYTPPKTGLNLLTIQLLLPPTFLYIPNSISTSIGSNPDIQEGLNDGFIQENYDLNVFGEIKDIQEIILIDYNQESSVFSWEKRAKLSGVNQPSNFLQERSIYDCLPGSFNKPRFYAFAFVTKQFFSKDTFFTGSSVKLINYVVKFSRLFSKNKKINNPREDPLSVEYYIPDLFYDQSGKKSIWSSNEIRNEAREYLINSILRLISRIGNFFSSSSGMPIIEVGHVNATKFAQEKTTSNSLRNCYEYLNNYIGIKKLGVNEDEKPYCNISNTNKKSKPYKCDCIDEDETMVGFCDQLTGEHFGSEGLTFLSTDQGFYKGINKDYRPEGCLISGTKNTSSINSLYNKDLLKKYNVPIIGNEDGLLNYYYNVQGIPNIKNAGKYNKLIFSRKYNDSETDKNVDAENNSLEKYYNIIISNLDKINVSIKEDTVFLKEINNFSNDFKLINLTVKNFFYDMLSNNLDFEMIIKELESALENFYISSLEKSFNIEYKDIKKNLDDSTLINPIKLLNPESNKTSNSNEIFILWFEIIYYIEIIIDMVNIMINEKESSGIKEAIHSNYNGLEKLLFKNNKNNKDNQYSDEFHTNEIHCDDVCLEWAMSIKDQEGNIIRQSCLTRPKPFLPDNKNNDPYPEYQNSYCNGKENGNNVCKPCCKYTKGPNSDGMCNVMIIPFPTTFFTDLGRFTAFGLLQQFIDVGRNVTIKEINKLFQKKDLMYDPDNKTNFYQILNFTSLLICKDILFNGGPLSFPETDIGAGDTKKNCKVISITQQNTFVFELNEVIGNINKII